MSISEFCWLFLKETLILLHGLFVFPLLLLILLLSTPIFIYRWGLSVWVKWFWKGKIGKLVTASGAPMAIEFLSPNPKYPPRLAVCVQVVVDGKLTVDELEESLNTKWLGKNSIYPEFKQFVEAWMGFMFWKPDLDFSVKNHLNSYNILGGNDEEMEENVCNFLEELLNKPFTPKRSPWEFHLIQNYRNEKLKNECLNSEMTLVVFRFHHCLADGYSILNAIIEGLCEKSINELSLPTPKEFFGLTSFRKLVTFILTSVIRIPYDLAHFTALVYYPRTPLYTPSEMQGCRLLYHRNEPIPIQQIKEIKNRIGVSFTSVLLAAISAAIARTLHKLQIKNGETPKSIDKTPFGVPLPMPGHTKKLRNQWTATHLELPTKLELGSIERLYKVERLLKRARKTTTPLVFPLLMKAIGSLSATTVKFVGKNRMLPAGFSSFPAPDMDIYLNGKRILGADGLGGIYNGITGAGFMLLTFRGYIRIAAMVVDGIMDREELKEMLGHIHEEFDNLHKLSIETQFVSEEQKLLNVV